MLKEVPVIFYPSKLKSILLFLVCLAFVSVIIFVNNTQEFVYWMSLFLFGVGSIIFFIQIVYPNSSYLKITEKGIEIKSLFKSSLIPWEIIKNFELGTIPIKFRNKKMVMINFDNSYKKQYFGRNLAKSMTGFEGGLPDNYGMKHEELVKILNSYKNKFKKKLKNIFNIKTEDDFQAKCLETFLYQYENVEVYRKFVDYLNINPSTIKQVNDLPFLPIEMFKNHQVLDKNFATKNYFQSSGTTQIQTRSKHFIADFSLYEESIYRSFEQFIGKPDDYIFLGLLPNYSENKHSSLIYMVDYLMKKSGKSENGYFLYNHQELFELLQKLGKENKKVILFGVSFALLDFLDSFPNSPILQFSNSLTIIETGGMKGRKEEMTKDELLKILKNGFGTERIFSEYSMTELLSQAYSLGNNEYSCPNWMRVLIRNTEDPFSYVENGKTGAINIIDLANVHSCSFIATQDLGKIVNDFEIASSTSFLINDKFQVLGRIDHSDIRGCSLLVS